MPLDYTHLKVDQTILHSNNQLLLVSNINIPENNFGELNQILDRVRQFIGTEYDNIEDIYYQVNATYDLRNTATGEIRHWSGSFNPRGNRHNILCDFQSYVLGTFNQQVIRACDPQNVYNKLRFFHAQTAWVFDKLTSAVISIQAHVDPEHPTVEHRDLCNVKRGRSKRVHLTFHLP